VAIAGSPETGLGGFGAAGNPDEAVQVALDECNKRSNGTRCVLGTAMQYGCVAFVTNTNTQNWAGGRGPDIDSAIADATSKLQPFAPGEVTGGGECSRPVTRP
jgi:Domain of unknown function (DUF4189)